MHLDPDNRSSRATGLTVLELLVVLAVVGILVTLLANNVFSWRDRAKQTATMADMRTLAMAVEAYSIDHNVPPPEASDFLAVGRLLDPYHFNATIPRHDHWRHLFAYESGSQVYTVKSLGKDGLLGKELTWETRFEFERDIVLTNGHFRYFPDDFEVPQDGSHGNGHAYGKGHGKGKPPGLP